MDTELTYLAAAVVLGLVQLAVAAQAFTAVQGLGYGMSARDAPPPRQQTAIGGRLDRAFRNFLETFPLAAAAILIAHLAARHNALTYWGAALYFWARLVYVPVYVAGVPVVRTAIWAAALVGIVLVLLGLKFG